MYVKKRIAENHKFSKYWTKQQFIAILLCKNLESAFALLYKWKFLGMNINEGFIQGITPSYLTNKQHNIVGKWYFFVVSIIEQFIDMQGQKWR